MREEILAAVESSSFDYTPFVHPAEPWKPEVADALRYKDAIAQYVKPTRILEIGIRAGYSPAAFLSSCPRATYIGIDMNQSIPGRALWGGRKNFMHHATSKLAELYPEATIETHVMDSLSPATREFLLAQERFDFVHVDGDHSEEGCYSDLLLAADVVIPGGFILVDDFKEEPPWNKAQIGVTAATKRFSTEKGWPYCYIPSGPGDALIPVPE